MERISSVAYSRLFDSPLESSFDSFLREWELVYEIQKKLGPYRLDFYFEKLSLCIEVDGLEFHNKRKAQDRLRDLYMLEVHKIKTARYPGWIVHKYPHACILFALRGVGYTGPIHKLATHQAHLYHTVELQDKTFDAELFALDNSKGLVYNEDVTNQFTL